MHADKYITNLFSRSLTAAETSLLSKGLTYVPKTDPQEDSINKSLKAFERSTRLKYFFRNHPPLMQRTPAKNSFLPPLGDPVEHL